MTATRVRIPSINELMANCPKPAPLADPYADAHCGTREEQAAAPRPVRKPAAPRKPRLTAAQIAPGTKVTFETDTCGRCSGTGSYPSSAWNGVCLGCNGEGKSLTAAGRAAKKAYDGWTAEHLTVPVTAIEPGMVIQASPVDPYRTVTAVGEPTINGRSCIGDGPWTDSVSVRVEFGPSRAHGLLADGTVKRAATPEEGRERAAHVAHLKGATLAPPSA
jgi:hypothetical protein